MERSHRPAELGPCAGRGNAVFKRVLTACAHRIDAVSGEAAGESSGQRATRPIAPSAQGLHAAHPMFRRANAVR